MAPTPNPEDGSIRVTLRDVYGVVTELRDAVNALNASAALTAFTATQANDRTSDHEVRLRTVEKWVYAIPATALIAIGSVAAAIFTAVTK